MKNKIVNELITAMKARVPEKQNLAGYLADTLCMGKEAVYRRLRGEVSFTLEEVALISRRPVSYTHLTLPTKRIV